MSKLLRGLAAGYGARKLGGGYFPTVLVFILLWWPMGNFGLFEQGRAAGGPMLSSRPFRLSRGSAIGHGEDHASAEVVPEVLQIPLGGVSPSQVYPAADSEMTRVT